MTNVHLYLPTVVPQWEIFAGVVLITIGYVDKKNLWTRLGWMVLILTGLTALYFNLFWHLNDVASAEGPVTLSSMLTSAGWQAVAGGGLALAALIMLQLKLRRYPILAVLTLLYFILIFFLYYQVSALSGKSEQTNPAIEQTRQK